MTCVSQSTIVRSELTLAVLWLHVSMRSELTLAVFVQRPRVQTFQGSRLGMVQRSKRRPDIQQYGSSEEGSTADSACAP